MTRKPKFLFDECSLGRPTAKALEQLLGFSPDEAEIAHVIDKYGEGATDEEWIPQAASEGWIIVTADAGKHKSKGEKLPIVCEKFAVTHIVFSRAVNRFSSFGRQRAIIDNWEGLVKTAEAPPGSRFSIRLANPKTGRTTLVLVKQPDVPKGKTQGQLFP